MTSPCWGCDYDKIRLRPFATVRASTWARAPSLRKPLHLGFFKCVSSNFLSISCRSFLATVVLPSVRQQLSSFKPSVAFGIPDSLFWEDEPEQMFFTSNTRGRAAPASDAP